MNEATVIDNASESRYELRDGNQVGGVLRYEDRGGVRVFTHTVVPLEHEGKGHGSKLAKAGLDDTRRLGMKVVAQCEFIDSYITRHPEYADLRSTGDRGDASR